MSTETSESVKRKLEEDDNTIVNVKKLKREESNNAGVLLFSGLTDYEFRNDKNLMKGDVIKWSPHRFASLKDVCIKDISSGPVSYFFYALTNDGKVYACGLNSKGQLGLDNFKNRRNPTKIDSLDEHNIVTVATGRQHGLFLTDDGDVYACGDNKSGQLGIGNKKEQVSVPTRIDYTGAPIIQIACGGEFSLILNDQGQLFSFGHPEYGQLGHGTENKEIAGKKEVFHCQYAPLLITSFIERDPDNGEVTYHGQPHIAKINCGVNHGCAIDTNQRLFTWGFGGYGRLGHNSTKNEFIPRLMKCWYRVTGRADGGITNVYCGQQFNIVSTTLPKSSLMFGQQALNKEANMYPKFIDDLSGWTVRHISCNQSGYIACADDSVIATQPSPCYGTLAMGPTTKSSAAPKLITTLKDVYCYKTGLGYMHSLYIVRDENDSDKKAIEKFPSVEFDETNKKPVESEPKKKTVSKKRKSK